MLAAMLAQVPQLGAFGTLALQVVMGISVEILGGDGAVRTAQPVLQVIHVLGAVISLWPVLRDILVLVEPQAAVPVLQEAFPALALTLA